MTGVTAVVFDWAGTAVDHGSLAPVRALQALFAQHFVSVTEDQARRDMGIAKRDHIRALLESLRGEAPTDDELDAWFAEVIPIQMDQLAAHSGVIPGVIEVAEKLRTRGIKIGSTTGYTRPMLDVLVGRAASEGYRPDCALCPEDAGAGRPWPWMCYVSAIRLGTYPMHTMVKIGDTISDIQEGLHAGMWTVGVARTGNLVGLSEEQWTALPEAQRAHRLTAARRTLRDAGAHYVIDSAGDVSDVIDVIDEIGARLSRGGRP
jgi:phosphonoacetaldehyde hydrolase